MTTTEPIADLAIHPDAEALARFDHPAGDMERWRATLIAKAWAGQDLACFFIDAEFRVARVVLIFPGADGCRARAGGIDMRVAEIGSTFLLDVIMRSSSPPFVERAELAGFP